MPNPYLIAGAAVGVLALLGRKGGHASHGPSDGALPASSIEKAPDTSNVKVEEVEGGATVKELPGEPVKLPPQVQTAPAPSAGTVVGDSLVRASLGLYGAAVKAGSYGGSQSPPIYTGFGSTPRTVAKMAMDAGEKIGAIW